MSRGLLFYLGVTIKTISIKLLSFIPPFGMILSKKLFSCQITRSPGLISYFLSCIFLVCLLFDLKGRILVCSIFLLTLIWLARKVLRIGQVLRPGRWTSGHIHGSAVKIGELMGDDALTAEHGVVSQLRHEFLRNDLDGGMGT